MRYNTVDLSVRFRQVRFLRIYNRSNDTAKYFAVLNNFGHNQVHIIIFMAAKVSIEVLYGLWSHADCPCIWKRGSDTQS